MAIETPTVAGIVAGMNPFTYEASSPYTLFLFQAFFIITLCQIVHYPLSKIRQPKVIAEVLTGILLGPTVMGHIPNFTATCFPPASIPGLTLIANVGIILFLFLIGLEVDVVFIRKHLKIALSVGVVNMAVPFGLGCAVSVGLYNEYRVTSGETPIEFTTYMVFIAVAMCITAFPVLARILTELNLINDRVGTTVLAAGITNDLLGWILLALSVTLANSANGVTTVYILLLAAGWFIFLLYPVSWVLRFWLTKYTKDLERGPSQISIMVIMMIVFVSSFFTDIIGVHPIFGAFMVGVIVPRENGFAIKITEKIEDLVIVVLVPNYFALSGLNTNLGLLNRGIDWGYVIGIIVIALVGKVSGGFVAAKFNGLLWRESLSVGVLMSCKGIVEIVVLSTGLKAGIITQRVFSMFIVMALVTTFLTTPLTLLSYPVWYREKVKKFTAGEINWDGTLIADDKTAKSDNGLGEADLRLLSPSGCLTVESLPKFRVSRVVVVLENLDSISNIMRLLHNLAFTDTSDADNESVDTKSVSVASNYNLGIHAIHLKEFTERTSHLIQASTADQTRDEDTYNPNYIDDSSFLNILRIFSELNGIHYSSQTILTTLRNRAYAVCDNLIETSDLLLTS
ncbi:hypothetical protein BABINDRAFT_27736, partial [Babjeviella inositovora NRRL Y-12698]